MKLHRVRSSYIDVRQSTRLYNENITKSTCIRMCNRATRDIIRNMGAIRLLTCGPGFFKNGIQGTKLLPDCGIVQTWKNTRINGREILNTVCDIRKQETVLKYVYGEQEFGNMIFVFFWMNATRVIRRSSTFSPFVNRSKETAARMPRSYK